MMVYFACNDCGSSLQKKAVEKHLFNCGSSLSCLDCLKDFSPESYAAHNKCITEDQKYGGQTITGPAVAKGEAKQEKWISNIQEALKTDSTLNYNQKQIMERLVETPNLPRKKSKFINMVRNSQKLYNEGTLETLWSFITLANTSAEKTEAKQADNINSEDVASKEEEQNDGKKDKKKKKKSNGLPDYTSVPPPQDQACDNKDEKCQSETLTNGLHDDKVDVSTLSKKERKRLNKEKKLSESEDLPAQNNEDLSKKERKKLEKAKKLAEQTNGIQVPDENLAKNLSKKEKRRQKQLSESASVDEQTNGVQVPDENLAKNLSKKEKKRQKQLSESASVDEQTNGVQVPDQNLAKNLSKKEKKRQKQLSESASVDEQNTEVAKPLSKKERKKLKQSEEQQHCDTLTKKERKLQKKRMLSGEDGEERKKLKKLEQDNGANLEEKENEETFKKFRWDKVIKAVLREEPDKELSLKKLKKKVISQYLSEGGEGKGEISMDNLNATFNYKVNHNPKFKVLKDRVSLV